MGVGDENTTLPTVLSCPICKKATLHCYDDTAREDIWFACDTCSAHGNIITFAAQIWKVDVPKALARFDEKNLCNYVGNADELEKFNRAAERGAAADRFWSSASAQLWAHDDANILHKFRDFGVSREIPCEKLVGVAYAPQVDELCRAMNRAFPANFSREPIIVLPYYDLPKRSSGFLLLQPDDELNLRKTFIGASRSSKYRPDAGYYLLDTATLPAKKVFNNSFFIAEDPLWVLQAQTSQLRYGDTMLPLCASFHGKDATSYGFTLQTFPHAKRFFAGKAVTPELISETAAGRGYLCIPPARIKMSPTSPQKTLKLLADISRSAVTWQTALEHVFKTQTNLAARAFIEKLNLPREKLQRFLQTRTPLSDAEIGRVLERVTPHHGANASKRSHGDVVERDECWYTTNGLLISDAIPVITRIIYTNAGDKYYEGYIKKAGVTYEFFTPSTAVDRGGLLNYVGHVLAEYGELVTYMIMWNAKALVIALTAHPPQVVTVSPDPGWNEKTREFQFRKYSLKVDGEVVPPPCPAICDKNPLNFPEPTTAPAADISNLVTPRPENNELWLLTGVALSGMLAPVLNADATNIVVDGPRYDKLLPAAKKLGFLVESLDPGNRTVSATTNAITDARWPTLIDAPNEEDDSYLYNGIMRGMYRPVVVRTFPLTQLVAATYGWCAFKPDALFNSLPDAAELQFLIPGYIQHVLRDRIILAPERPLVVNVLADLQKWLDVVCGKSFNLAAVEKLLLLPNDAHLLLMRDINAALDTGEIALLPQPRHGRQPKDFIIRNRQHWWIGKAAIQGYYKRKIGIAPYWPALLNCFGRSGILVAEKEINNAAGCLLQKSWCDNFRAAEKERAEKNAG